MHIHPQFEHLKEDIHQFIIHFDAHGENVTIGQRNSIKKFTAKDGTVVNIKSFKIPDFFNGIIYKFIRKSKAKRSFQYAERLIKLGISTPFPIAYIEETSALSLKSSYYISQHINYDFDFRKLIHQSQFPNRNIILEQFTAFTFKLHENDINFLDHSPGNTLIVKQSENNYDFYLIDLNRMRFETMTFEKRIHNFRRLWLSRAMIKVMAKKYAELSGKPYKETQSLMLKYSRGFQKKVNSKKLRRSGRVLKFNSR